MICRACNNGEVREYLDLGEMPMANAFVYPSHGEDAEPRLHTVVGVCNKCNMSQLMEVWPRDQVFHDNYAYYSSTSSVMDEHWSQLAAQIGEMLFSSGPIVEIGCNDGALLEKLVGQVDSVIGVEPSGGVADAAENKGLHIERSFFDKDIAQRIVERWGRAQLVVGGNVLSHIEDLDGFAEALDALLEPAGVFIFEDPWILDILESNAYDQIYNEHVYFFSLHSLSAFFRSRGWEIYRVEPQPVHGGSLRVWGSREGAHRVEDSVRGILLLERDAELTQFEEYAEFGERAAASRGALLELLDGLKGKKIVGYAASSKGTVILNYCGIGEHRIPYVVDNTPGKIGMLMPGVHIPIVAETAFRQDDPDYALLLSYNHLREIAEKEQEWVSKGGRFITHVPYPSVIRA